MKIVVIGGAGYIGSALIPVLIDHGYNIDVVDLLWFGNHLPKTINVKQIDAFKITERDLKGYDQCIFLAGLSNDPMAEYNPAKNFIYNAALPCYLAFQAKIAGIHRFIYASSCSVYGYTVNKLYDEESPVICSYPYGISKLQGENGCLHLQDKDFSVIALRQGTVCGYSPRLRMDLIINTMYKSAVTESKIVINNPSIWRPILDIRDAINAYLRAIQIEYTISGIFNIATANYTVGQVGDTVKNELDKVLNSKIQLVIKNIQDVRNYKVSIEKAQTYLGFQPQYSIKDTVLDLHNHLSSVEDLNSDKYYNIKVFKKLQI